MCDPSEGSKGSDFTTGSINADHSLLVFVVSFEPLEKSLQHRQSRIINVDREVKKWRIKI